MGDENAMDLRDIVADEFMREACRHTMALLGPSAWLVQHVKNGPWMPARTLVSEAGWCVEDGAARHDAHPDPAQAPRMMWLWRYGKPCSEIDHALASARVEYAQRHAPDSPYAHPGRPYDPRTAAPVF